ncbi:MULTISPECIES: Cna B-type domain-containing protein [Streptococcus]|jgi:wall-associated protein|uniref:Cna B-type domain-containing protein n=1 Tax=Streptococcus gordonii TaxID=1302 RepID=A0AB35FTS7_STRGN|nr:MULTISPECIES: Cna B-type domain-containing protein [Streptococcus]ARC47706.1 Cna B-type domain-containing protein [Streptococcus gordonii]MBZ2127248.1 Cna B-type domain-containing protein [Streptococcus gordonii]MBZ2129086.1 Cna B-type domain-containing protein [Streptococcus gordonii]MDN5019525.1 Cna B-type domain-containing protein [Streptococcus sp. SG1]RSJ51320.1 Collagen adhesin precursor [Streptococcus gordonii]
MKEKNNLVLKFFILLSAIVFGLGVTKSAQATEVTDYTNNVTITKNGSPLTSDTTVTTNETLAVTSDITFPDSQAINSGDTLTLKLPQELTLITVLNFNVIDVKNDKGEVVGTAQVDPNNQTVTVTFSDYFSRLPENKRMSLNFNVRLNNDTVKESGPVSFRFGQTDFSFQYKKDDGQAGEYEMKYGYQDKSDPSIVKWRIILNARQDMLRGMVISDNFGDGLTLVPGSLRAVRYAPVQGGIRNEAHLLTLPVLDNFTKKAVLSKNANGDVNGFTINFGDNYNWPMYIEYSTRVAPGTKVGDTVNNKLSWSATNFPEERTINRSLRLEAGSGDGSAERSKDVVIKAQKTLVGKELTKGQFSFGLYDDKGQLLQTATNEADGSINFAAINYSQAGTFNYVIKEIPGQEDGYTYDSKEVKVTVKVVDVLGEKFGSVSYDGDATFTNTYKPVTSVSGHKTWVNDTNMTRPQSITVNLYANNQVVASKVVSEADGWNYTFSGLPVNDENGQKITYTIGEDAIVNYSSKVEGYDLINTYDPPTIPSEPGKDKPSKPGEGDPNDPGRKTPDPKVEDPKGSNKQDPKTPGTKKADNKPILPKTGEQAAIWLSVAGVSILVILGGVFVVLRKKNKQ